MGSAIESLSSFLIIVAVLQRSSDASARCSPGAGDGTTAERVQYSFITLTTAGYGDFVPAADVTRTTAATEASIGQVYLVTIVALLVSNIGAQRQRPDPS